MKQTFVKCEPETKSTIMFLKIFNLSLYTDFTSSIENAESKQSQSDVQITRTLVGSLCKSLAGAVDASQFTN